MIKEVYCLVNVSPLFVLAAYVSFPFLQTLHAIFGTVSVPVSLLHWKQMREIWCYFMSEQII